MPDDLTALIARTIKALRYAYTGSAELGSFLRGTANEYVPNVFMLIEDLERARSGQGEAPARDAAIRHWLYEAWNALTFDWESAPEPMRRSAVAACRKALDDMLTGFEGKPFAQWCREQFGDDIKPVQPADTGAPALSDEQIAEEIGLVIRNARYGEHKAAQQSQQPCDFLDDASLRFLAIADMLEPLRKALQQRRAQSVAPSVEQVEALVLKTQAAVMREYDDDCEDSMRATAVQNIIRDAVLALYRGSAPQQETPHA